MEPLAVVEVSGSKDQIMYGVGSLLTRETVQVEQSDMTISVGVVNPKFAPYRFLI